MTQTKQEEEETKKHKERGRKKMVSENRISF